MIEDIKKLLVKGRGNVWLYGPNISVYVRVSRRYLDMMGYDDVLDISNVSAEVTGMGTFTALIDKIEAECGANAIYIENVMTHRFEGFFIKRGYSRVMSGNLLPSYYKILKEQYVPRIFK